MTEHDRIANSHYFEGITSIRAVINGVEKGVNDRRIETVYFDAGAKDKKKRELCYLKNKSGLYGYDIKFVSRYEIDKMSVGTTHGGIIAKCSERKFNTALPSSIDEKKFIVMLDGIEDPFNFGYALRSLYAFGADMILLPERNWMSAAEIVCRSSAGASEMIEIFSTDPLDAVEHFKKLGVSVIATALEKSVPISEINVTFPLLLIIGGEKRGISKSILEAAEQVARIDYGRNFMSSLSAASAAAILGYEISERLKNVKFD